MYNLVILDFSLSFVGNVETRPSKVGRTKYGRVDPTPQNQLEDNTSVIG